MNTIIILLVVATLAYFLFLKPKTSIVGTWLIQDFGTGFWYFAPDKTMRFFSMERDMLGRAVFSENPSTATYTVSGSNVVVQMSADSLPITYRLELNGKLLVSGNKVQKSGLFKISDNLLAPKQMAEFIDTSAIAGIITQDQLAALDKASRPLLQ